MHDQLLQPARQTLVDYNHVAVFAEVVSAGSFAGAARSLGMPTATVSRQVAQLEAALGARLLQRTTRKVEFTSLGQAYYEQATLGLSGLRQAQALIAAAQSEPTGTLRVLAPVAFGSHHLVRWLPDFLAAHEKVRIELMLAETDVDLIDARIDVALRLSPLDDSSLVARQLAPTRQVLVASPAYLDRAGALPGVEALAQHDCIVFGHPADDTVWRLQGPHGTFETMVHGRIQVDGSHAALVAACAGLGIALLPMLLVHADLDAGRLLRVLPGVDAKGPGLHALFPSQRHMSRAVRAFIDHLVRRAGELPA